MKRNGFTLLELLLVIAIIGIVAGLAAPDFMRFVRKSRIENQTRRLYADIMNARVMAMNRNISHFVVFNYLGNADQYGIIADTNGNNTANVPPTGAPAGDTQVLQRGGADTQSFTFTGARTQSQNMSNNLGNQVIINARGIARGAGTICVGNTTAVGTQPSCNCIVVNATQIRMGRIHQLGAACDATNCD